MIELNPGFKYRFSLDMVKDDWLHLVLQVLFRPWWNSPGTADYFTFRFSLDMVKDDDWLQTRVTLILF